MATFGYDTIGSSRYANDDITGSTFSAPEDGTVDSITVYGNDLDFIGPNVTCAYYDDDNSDAFVADTEEISWTAGNAEWRTLSFSGSPSITSGTNYWLVAWANSTGPGYAYDSGTTGQGQTDASGTYNTFPDPLSPSTTDRKYSIYATYTASTAFSFPPVSPLGGVSTITYV